MKSEESDKTPKRYFHSGRILNQGVPNKAGIIFVVLFTFIGFAAGAIYGIVIGFVMIAIWYAFPAKKDIFIEIDSQKLSIRDRTKYCRTRVIYWQDIRAVHFTDKQTFYGTNISIKAHNYSEYLFKMNNHKEVKVFNSFDETLMERIKRECESRKIDFSPNGSSKEQQ